MRKKEKLEFLPVKYFDDNNIVISPGKKNKKQGQSGYFIARMKS